MGGNWGGTTWHTDYSDTLILLLPAAIPAVMTSRPPWNSSSSKWTLSSSASTTSIAALLRYMLVMAVWNMTVERSVDPLVEHARCTSELVKLSSIWGAPQPQTEEWVNYELRSGKTINWGVGKLWTEEQQNYKLRSSRTRNWGAGKLLTGDLMNYKLRTKNF